MNILVTKIGHMYREMVAREIKKRFDACGDVFLVNYHRLKATDVTRLRKNLKAAGASVLVTKNSYMRKAFGEMGKSQQAIDLLDGTIALIFAKTDVVSVSKVIADFAKENEALQIRGGFLSDKVLSVDDVKRLATLPSKQVMYQQLAGVLNEPVRKLAMSLNQILAKVGYAIKAVADKKKDNQ